MIFTENSAIILEKTAVTGESQGGSIMATTTRPELSPNNRWWISKHRYYELKHFCLQYGEWRKRLSELDGMPGRSPGTAERIDRGYTDPTAACAQERMMLEERIGLVDSAAYEACGHQFWYTFLVNAVTEGASYDVLEARYGIMPIARNEWYELYRKFFWILDLTRR